MFCCCCYVHCPSLTHTHRPSIVRRGPRNTCTVTYALRPWRSAGSRFFLSQHAQEQRQAHVGEAPRSPRSSVSRPGPGVWWAGWPGWQVAGGRWTGWWVGGLVDRWGGSESNGKGRSGEEGTAKQGRTIRKKARGVAIERDWTGTGRWWCELVRRHLAQCRPLSSRLAPFDPSPPISTARCPLPRSFNVPSPSCTSSHGFPGLIFQTHSRQVRQTTPKLPRPSQPPSPRSSPGFTPGR